MRATFNPLLTAFSLQPKQPEQLMQIKTKKEGPIAITL